MRVTDIYGENILFDIWKYVWRITWEYSRKVYHIQIVTKGMQRRVKEEERGIVHLKRFVFHFSRDLSQWINEMSEPRDLSYINYTQSGQKFILGHWSWIIFCRRK